MGVMLGEREVEALWRLSVGDKALTVLLWIHSIVEKGKEIS